MSNIIAFRMAERRAIKAESARKSFNEDISVEVPAQTILFAASVIEKLSLDVAKLKLELARRKEL